MNTVATTEPGFAGYVRRRLRQGPVSARTVTDDWLRDHPRIAHESAFLALAGEVFAVAAARPILDTPEKAAAFAADTGDLDRLPGGFAVLDQIQFTLEGAHHGQP